MSPCISRSDSIAASTTNNNIIAGDIFEFLSSDGAVSAGFSQSATGLLVTVQASERTLVRNLVPVIKATTPLIPDDLILRNAPVLAGERLVISAANTTAGALTLLSVICIDEVM